MVADATIMGHRRADRFTARWDTPTPEYRWRPPRSYLLGAERGNPDGVRPVPVGPTQEGHNPRRDTKTQEAKAARRKARGIHNPADRAIMARPKGSQRGSGGPPDQSRKDCQNQRDKLDAAFGLQTDPAMKRQPGAAVIGQQGW